MDSSESETFLRGLKQVYLDENNFSDLKLRTKDNMLISAHKVILAARSPVLKSRLEKECSKPGFDGTLEVPVDAKPLVSILHWMYTDELLLETGKHLEAVTNGAATLELTGLMKLLDRAMIKFCKPHNMLELFRVAEKHHMHIAMEQLAKYIKTNIESLLPVQLTEEEQCRPRKRSESCSSSSSLNSSNTRIPAVEIKKAEESLLWRGMRYFLIIVAVWFIFVIITAISRRVWGVTLKN